MKTHCIIFSLLLLIIVDTKAASIDTLKKNTLKPFTIIGKVIDQTNEEPIIQATVRLLSPKDSSFIKGAVTELNGSFSIKGVTANQLLLHISYLGYKTYYKTLQIKPNKTGIISLPTIQIKEDSRILSELIVTGQQSEMIVKKDTIEYNADAFDMEEGATVEDILTRVPGIDVDEEGKIETKGKSVTKIYVDGKEMFKGDMTMVTKNIPADIIDKIQVITDKTELAKLTGIDDGEELTVINITIKKGKKKGWIINAEAGAGSIYDPKSTADLRYKTKAYINRIQGDDNLMISLNSDNLKSGAGALGRNNKSSLGVSFSSERDKTLQQYGDIRYNASQNASYSHRYRENYFVDSTSYQRDSSQNESQLQGINANYNLSYKPNDRHTIQIRPSLNLNQSKSINRSNNYTQAGDETQSLVNFSRQENNQSGIQFSAGGNMDYSWKINEKGRRFSTSFGLNINNNHSEGTRNSENRFLLLPSKDKSYDQRSNTQNDQINTNAYLSYVEPIGDKNYLQAAYTISYGNQQNINMTYDYNDHSQQYDSLNHIYSKSFSNVSLDQRLSLSFQRMRERYNFSIGGDINPNYKDNYTFVHKGNADLTDSIIFSYDGRTTVRYAPRANLSYNFSKHQHLRFDYRGQMNHPSVGQLDPTVDFTNPLHIRKGNPNLLPSFTHQPSIAFNNYNQTKQRSLSIDLRGRYMTNDIVNVTEYESVTGIQNTAPRNESGTWNISTGISYNFPIGKQIQINSYTTGGYDNKIGYTVVSKQSEKNISKTLSLRESFSISFRLKWMTTRLRLNANYQDVTYSVAQKKGQQTLSYTASSNWKFTLPANWEVSTDLRFRGNNGYSTGFNQQELLWDMEISKRLLPKKIGIIRLEINDILQQKLNIRRTYTSNYMQDQQNSTQQSYFLLSFALNFNTMGGGKKG